MSLLSGLSLNDPTLQLSQVFESEIEKALELLSDDSIKNSDGVNIVKKYLTSQYASIQNMVNEFQLLNNNEDTSTLFDSISVCLNMFNKPNVSSTSAPSTNIIIDATKKILTKCKAKKKVEKEPKAKKTNNKSKKSVEREQVQSMSGLNHKNVFDTIVKEDDNTESQIKKEDDTLTTTVLQVDNEDNGTESKVNNEDVTNVLQVNKEEPALLDDESTNQDKDIEGGSLYQIDDELKFENELV